MGGRGIAYADVKGGRTGRAGPRIAVEAEVPADEVEGTVGWEMEGYHGHVGGARAGLAVGIATGSERIPDMVATIPCDAHEENRKKRKSNDLRQRQFYEREIIQEINVINDEHDRRRQRTEAGPSSSGDVVGRQMMEGGGRDSGIMDRKRCREEGAATREEDRGQGKGIERVRARTGRAGLKKWLSWQRW